MKTAAPKLVYSSRAPQLQMGPGRPRRKILLPSYGIASTDANMRRSLKPGALIPQR